MGVAEAVPADEGSAAEGVPVSAADFSSTTTETGGGGCSSRWSILRSQGDVQQTLDGSSSEGVRDGIR